MKALRSYGGRWLGGFFVGVAVAGASAASAGTRVTTNACFQNATARYTNIDITMAGTGSPDPGTAGVPITLSGSSLQASVPAALLLAGYNLGLLVVGVNNIPVSWWAARAASNTVEGFLVRSGSVGATTTITDPDGIPGSGDETATSLNLNISLANTTWTPTGGNVEFRQAPPGSLPTIPAGVAGSGAVTPTGSVFFSASVAGGLIRANFDCQPGLTDLNGPDNVLGNADDATTFVPSTALPFDTVTVAGGSTTTTVPSTTTTTTVPPNKCAAAKLKAAGKRAACMLGEQAKATQRGLPVNDEKVQRCKDKFATSFMKAEAKPPCLTTADTNDVGNKVDVFVEDVTSDLVP